MSLEFEKTCSHTPWAILQKSLLVMDMESRTCRLHHENELLAEPSLQIIMPLSPILQQITDALMRDANQQQQIHFPPNIIPSLPDKKSSQS